MNRFNAPLSPRISATAARRMERMAGNYLAFNQEGALTFIKQLRAARKKGSGTRAIKQERENAEETSEAGAEAEAGTPEQGEPAQE